MTNFFLLNRSARYPLGVCVKSVIKLLPVKKRPILEGERLNTRSRYSGRIMFTLPIPVLIVNSKKKNKSKVERYSLRNIEGLSIFSLLIELLPLLKPLIRKAGILLVMLTNVAMMNTDFQPRFSIINPLITGVMIPETGMARFIIPKTDARFSGVVFSEIIAIRVGIKRAVLMLYKM